MTLRSSAPFTLSALETVPTLSTADLGRRFGEFEALRNLRLEIASGECVAVLGRNGSGKTTAVRLIAGLLEPTSGSIHLEGVSVAGADASVRARAEIAIVADTPSLYEDLSVREHLELVALAHGANGEGVDDRIIGILDRLGLAAKAGARPGELSRGMRQKVSLACALIRPLRLLVLDEPVVGLDPGSQRILRELIVETKRAGKAVLLTTHQLDFAREIADRAIVLVDGEVVADGPYDQVVASDVVLAQGLT